MDDQMNYFELQAVKDKPLANTLGELKLKAGERAWLVDDETVYVKIKNANGNIGFVPSSSLKNKPNLEDKDGLIFMVVCSYNKRENDELSITTGELVRIKAIADDGWCYAKSNSKWGWIPGNHLIPQFAGSPIFDVEPETSNMYDNLAVAFDEELDYSPEKQPSADQ
ncbi:hypothetical protein RF11_02963 [Thelohanellus kitauei]|uniref:SH3 domain-containing protein n=1 Tax=Thelohanellus kitauei TaxID=669202 RepID=A0A0C2MVQ0_THEKT|nr:hypothetical protein RF11_02963 [Thelohanellus kitauei]